MDQQDDERQWVRRSRGGDPEAFGVLVERYEGMVHTLTYRMTGSLADAEDVAQEVFLRAYDRLANLREEGKFAAWLRQIAVNTSLNWLKRQKHREALARRWAAEAEGPRQAGYERSEPDDERAQRVTAALLRLPAKQRAAVVLTLCEGLSHGEAARALGCAEATVSWRVFAARAKLKRWLRP